MIGGLYWMTFDPDPTAPTPPKPPPGPPRSGAGLPAPPPGECIQPWPPPENGEAPIAAPSPAQAVDEPIVTRAIVARIAPEMPSDQPQKEDIRFTSSSVPGPLILQSTLSSARYRWQS